MDEYDYPYETGPDLGPNHHTSVSHWEPIRVTRWDDEAGPVKEQHQSLVLSESDPLMREWSRFGVPPRVQVGDWKKCLSCGEQFFTVTESHICATCEVKHRDA